MGVRFPAWLAIVAIGCGPSTAPHPDGPDEGATRATVTWSLTSQVPGQVGPTDLDVVTFNVKDLRLIGDSSSTTVAPLIAVTWSVSQTPPSTEVPSFAPGLYSQVGLGLDGGNTTTNSYYFKGTFQLNGVTQKLVIDDYGKLALSLPVQIDVETHHHATFAVQIDLAHALEAIDYTRLYYDAGTYYLDEKSPQIATWRAALTAAFSVSGSSQ